MGYACLERMVAPDAASRKRHLWKGEANKADWLISVCKARSEPVCRVLGIRLRAELLSLAQEAELKL